MLKKRVLIACYSESSKERLKTILSEYGFVSVFIRSFKDIEKISLGQVALAIVIIKHGFECSDLIVITEQDLFGSRVIKTSNEIDDKKNLEKIIREQNNINIGDLVIHKEYGLGRFIDLETIDLENLRNDYLKIVYADNANIFVPIEDFDLITRYSDYNQDVVLDKLGSRIWNEKKNRVKEKLELIAKDLIKIASLRRLAKAPILAADENEYREFCSKFEYTETDDQLKAIKDVENDFKKGIPADRLICGDVGFGKTEVALRSAFIAASSEKNHVQVAIITPTTLLCKQHYSLFKERFKYTGLNIATISRLISNVENKKVKEELKDGNVDIIIGTHALLSESVKFKNLGLVIVDEEQRFGVKQKEKLKNISSNIHLITLSATPIPRTLQMSMTGIRDLSLITTPPVDRLNTDTYVMKFDEIILKEAIKRELSRNGKIIFVVPRISDIPEVKIKLNSILDINDENNQNYYKSANGQMNSNDLDEIINEFYDGKFSILLATTIVESGLDIPKANTIIIYRADRFGLSELYQLRGRVGRGKEKAYAYLTIKATDVITENAKKRLKVIENIHGLGGGFTIASNDMEIRGSGNIVGEEQSGHIKDVGAELYNQLLIEAVEKIKKSGSFSNRNFDFSPEIKLNLSTAINKNYINDIGLRLSYYKKLANISDNKEEENILIELENKFGKIPQEIFNLIKISKIKLLCKKLEIIKLEKIGNLINIKFFEDNFRNPEYLMDLIKNEKAKMLKQNILSFNIGADPTLDKLNSILSDMILSIEK